MVFRSYLLKELPCSVVEVVEVEADKCQLGSVVGGREGVRSSDLLPPGPCQPRRLVDVAVQRQQRLPVFDEALNRDAADVGLLCPGGGNAAV